MTKIIAFAHKKQSGKSSSCNFLADYIKSRYLNNTSFYGRELVGGLEQNLCAVKIYSFADKLKQFAVECLGLTHEQCYGTDEDKNSLTNLKWCNMPGFYSSSVAHEMTAREVLQYFGTGICRKMYPNIWVDACLRQIEKDNCVFALISDCRFVNEGQAVQAKGGKVVDFTRCPFPQDRHESEIALDNFNFDAIVDNKNMTLREKNETVLQLVKDWGWL